MEIDIFSICKLYLNKHKICNFTVFIFIFSFNSINLSFHLFIQFHSVMVDLEQSVKLIGFTKNLIYVTYVGVWLYGIAVVVVKWVWLDFRLILSPTLKNPALLG